MSAAILAQETYKAFAWLRSVGSNHPCVLVAPLLHIGGEMPPIAEQLLSQSLVDLRSTANSLLSSTTRDDALQRMRELHNSVCSILENMNISSKNAEQSIAQLEQNRQNTRKQFAEGRCVNNQNMLGSDNHVEAIGKGKGTINGKGKGTSRDPCLGISNMSARTRSPKGNANPPPHAGNVKWWATPTGHAHRAKDSIHMMPKAKVNRPKAKANVPIK